MAVGSQFSCQVDTEQWLFDGDCSRVRKKLFSNIKLVGRLIKLFSDINLVGRVMLFVKVQMEVFLCGRIVIGRSLLYDMMLSPMSYFWRRTLLLALVQ